MANRIRHYFALERPELGGSGVDRQVVLFTGVVAGVVAEWAVAVIRGGEPHWGSLVIGLVASVVIFPAIFYNAGLNEQKANFVKWCVAFQNGYFWPALLEQIAGTS